MYKVLLIEDEDIMREGVKMSINWAKIDCRIVGEASDGEMAVSQIKTLVPDIVLLDINMPLLNGLEVLQRCQIEKQVFATIIISGYNDFEKAKQAIKYGVTDYLLKPLDHEELIQALHRCKESLLLKRQYQTFKEKIHEVSERELFVFKQTEAAVQPSKSIRALLALIEERYDEKISVQDIADELGRSKTYLNQKFKAITGYTFNDYLNRYRISQAILLLEKGEDKISTIALDVGFSNYRYFIDIFKKYTHILPSEFMQYAKNNNKSKVTKDC